MTSAGWEDVASDNQTKGGGRDRLRNVIGLASSTLRGPRHLLQWTSKFTRKLEKSSFGGEAYALCEMIDFDALTGEFSRALCGLVARHGGVGRLRKPFYLLSQKEGRRGEVSRTAFVGNSTCPGKWRIG